MGRRLLFTEETLAELGDGYYLIFKRFAPEWCGKEASEAEVECLRECCGDFDAAFQFRVERLYVSAGMSFRSMGRGRRRGTFRDYGRSLVLVLRRLPGIPSEEEASRRCARLAELERERFRGRELAKGRVGSNWRGSRPYSGAELGDLGVFMHRLSLRLTGRWLETHGGGHGRVFRPSYHSMLVDGEALGLLGLPRRGEEASGTAGEAPELYVGGGALGTLRFHRMTRGLAEEGLTRLLNPRSRVGPELLAAMEERVREEPLRDTLRTLLADWGEDLLRTGVLALTTRPGIGQYSQRVHVQFLSELVVGMGFFGWCISSEVVRRAYRRWQRRRGGDG